MTWLESHKALREHPKTKRAARSLGIPTVHLVGHLHYLWYWAMDYAPDGDLSAFDPEDIADAADWTGDPDAFIKALVSAGGGRRPGFLEERDGLHIHDWIDHGGRLAESRRVGGESGRYGNHKRWHLDRGVSDDNCTLCIADRPESGGESGGESPRVATGQDSTEENSTEEKPLKPRKRATQQPDNFQPTEAHRTFAAAHGLDLDWQFQKFTTHHKAKGTTFKDWDAGLWTWLRNAVEYAGKSGGNSRPPPRTQQVSDFSTSAGEKFVP